MNKQSNGQKQASNAGQRPRGFDKTANETTAADNDQDLKYVHNGWTIARKINLTTPKKLW